MQNLKVLSQFHQRRGTSEESQQHNKAKFNQLVLDNSIRKSSMNSEIDQSIQQSLSIGVQNIEILKALQKSITQIIAAFKTNVQKINEILEQSIQLLQGQVQSCQKQVIQLKGIDSGIIENEQVKLSQTNQKIKNTLQQEFMNLSNGMQFNELNQQINQFQTTLEIKNHIVKSNKFPFQTLINEISVKQFNKNQIFNYHLLETCCRKQQQYCYTIAFNKDSSLLATGCEESIKIFEFNKGDLKELYKLNGHSKHVRCLYFQKNQNFLLSGGEDKIIIIWKFDEQKKWIIYKTLANHLKWIACIIMNPNEDLLISGSGDKTIKFWSKQSDWNCFQTIPINTDIVSCLSLNDSITKLIACEWNGMILVIEHRKEWHIVQTINVYKEKGFRACFIDDNQFSFQPYSSKYLHIYECDQKSQQFYKTKDVEIPEADNDCSLFPQQFIKSKQLLISKHGKYLNIIQRQQNGEFKTVQSIDIGYIHFFGAISEDGNFLVVWVDSLKQIQVYQYKQEIK